MKKLRKSLSILLSILIVIGLSGCSSTPKTEQTGSKVEGSTESAENNLHYPVTISTYNYKKEPVEVTFEKAPEKVVAIYQNSIETMLALGLEDKIVAAAGLDHDVKEEYKEAFSKVNYLEEFTPSKESIIMTQPDMILGWYSLFDDKRLGEVDYWHDNNINTYISLNSGAAEDRTIENEINDILNLGKIFNVEEKAQALADEINKEVESVAISTKDQEKQSTLILEFFDDKISTYGTNTLGGDMVTKLGAKLLHPEGKGISTEDLINLNPDSIFVVYMDKSDEKVPEQEVNRILENKALKSLNAVKNKRVYPIALGEMYSSGIRTIDGIKTFANGLYPNLEK
ncbi:iron ABC transporter substrate-binding protein [Romboutsia weinsteinii]|uniref:Iron ABC transporter substrate-binding protein n=1 Tax=Romboutsia weinsteinii TaxID=2020949 RepID=A0A371J8K1_9FIRM|nr:ABC transporter substrate-binding protein [Romboutsia weinsteinii]RDY28998.1 iron ABC transporter substrate-binding protein [Romboutsia weinsteinii]